MPNCPIQCCLQLSKADGNDNNVEKETKKKDTSKSGLTKRMLDEHYNYEYVHGTCSLLQNHCHSPSPFKYILCFSYNFFFQLSFKFLLEYFCKTFMGPVSMYIISWPEILTEMHSQHTINCKSEATCPSLFPSFCIKMFSKFMSDSSHRSKRFILRLYTISYCHSFGTCREFLSCLYEYSRILVFVKFSKKNQKKSDNLMGLSDKKSAKSFFFCTIV